MRKTSHPRPNLDHLRRQAKDLLRELPVSDDAAHVFIAHLPAARGMTTNEVRAAGFRLADAQSTIARREGFAKWPGLTAHVAALRALEGTWRFDTVVIDGARSAFGPDARLLLDGDWFRMQEYEGVFNIDVEARPRRIDIHFIEGPEAGNVCAGIFALDRDRLTFCLPLSAGPRPTEFVSLPGSGHALEVLMREDSRRPTNVTGGNPPRKRRSAAPHQAPVSADSPVLRQLEGEWQAVAAMRDGQTMPEHLLRSGRRTGAGNRTQVSFGGHVVVDATIRIDESHSPMHIDYWLADGSVQLGLVAFEEPEVIFCAAPPGDPRPKELASATGSGVTLSRWRRR